MNAPRSSLAALSVSTSLALCIGAFASAAFGAPLTLTFDSFTESKTVGSPLLPGSEIRLDGRLRDSDGSSISNTLLFAAGSSALSFSAGWLVAPLENRTVGVNIDLFDSTNSVVATDTFLGVVGALAASQLTASNLIAGAQYRLLLTGTALQAGRFQIDLVDGATPPPLAPLAVATPAADHALFDTHLGSKTFGTIFTTGDSVQIDGVLADDLLSSITNDFHITITANTLSAGIEWIVGAQDPRRTIGVNVDLFDSSNNVVASDIFMGLFDDQAFSQLLVTGLTPGVYTLRFTGIAQLGGRYRIDLTTDEIPPGFEPINDNPPNGIPEPATLVLLGISLAGLGFSRRKQ